MHLFPQKGKADAKKRDRSGKNGGKCTKEQQLSTGMHTVNSEKAKNFSKGNRVAVRSENFFAEMWIFEYTCVIILA